jgi:glycosyltransferase involved in cell wall biosynthesis
MTGVPLKIAAKYDPKDQEYFEQVVKPMLADPLITWLGPIGEEQKRDLLKNARALLLPIDWPEPFGMVFIEALACGTPVITRARGAVLELLEDGVTGYIRETEEELADAVRNIRGISRMGCRTYAQRRFDIRRMAMEYVNVYAHAQRRQRFSLGAATNGRAPRNAVVSHAAEGMTPLGIASSE